jgi:hypothetical protein
MIYKKVCVHHQSSMVRFFPLVGTTPFPAGTKHNKTIHPRNKSLRICLKDLLKLRPRQTSWTVCNRLWLPLRRAPCAASTVQSLPSGGPEGSQQLVEMKFGNSQRARRTCISFKEICWMNYIFIYIRDIYDIYNPFMWRWFCYVRWLGLHVSKLMHGTCLHHMLRVADRNGMGRTTALHQFCPGFLVGGHSFSQGGIAPLQARCSWALLEQGIEKEINRHWILMCSSI